MPPHIGPQIPNGSGSPDVLNNYSVGPQLPSGFTPEAPRYEEEEEDEDDYAPALPPDLVATRTGGSNDIGSSRRVHGPAMGPMRREEEEESDDEVGPVPLPQGVVLEEEDGVREFLEKEEQRRKAIEVRDESYIFLHRIVLLSLPGPYTYKRYISVVDNDAFSRKLQNPRL